MRAHNLRCAARCKTRLEYRLLICLDTENEHSLFFLALGRSNRLELYKSSASVVI